MFSGIRERWREARASELRKEVEDSFQRLRAAGNEANLRFATHAADILQRLESQFGRLDRVSSDAKLKIAKELRGQARASFDQDQGQAYALFFISADLDAQTLPGSDAVFVKAMCASLLDAAMKVAKGDCGINPIQAIKSGNLVDFRYFLQANPHSLDMTYEPNHWTLLHCLAALGSRLLPVHSTMALDLIQAGANLNCRTPLGWTPLIMIAIEGQKEAMPLATLLIEHGADVAAVDDQGCDWRHFWQHGKEIAALLNAAMTPSQREINDQLLQSRFSTKG
jgi:hypothetical protein